MKIKYTKKGQPYYILSNGRARFVKRTSARRVKSKIRGGYIMAKRKSFIKRISHSRNYGVVGTIATAAAYGALREKISTAISPLTSKIPLGAISDEVGMALLAILAKRMIKTPMVTKIADAALVIESARIGQAAINGQIGLGGSSSSQSDLFNGGGL